MGNTSAKDIEYDGMNLTIDNVKQSPWGYRIGWQWDQNGAVTNLEFGKMPNAVLVVPGEMSQLDKLFTNNPYFNYLRLTFQFNIFNGDKNYKQKQ
jgi:hypothetical protein